MGVSEGLRPLGCEGGHGIVMGPVGMGFPGMVEVAGVVVAGPRSPLYGFLVSLLEKAREA